MSALVQEYFEDVQQKVERGVLLNKQGRVVQVTGVVIESEGPEVGIGELVQIYSKDGHSSASAEVVGFKDKRVLLMPLEILKEVNPGCKVVGGGRGRMYPVGDGLKGRVLNGVGEPIDDRGVLRCDYVREVDGEVPNPMTRKKIEDVFETGVKAIDSFLPMGKGQRSGIFAGSGVGKSSLLGMIARGGSADVNVIALIGERGRELREFIENDLGEEGLKKSILVIATSDQPAPMRVKAAFLASKIAEYYREQGKNVLFLMDSLTRLGMAQREIGLAIGEPPTSRGYTPSVFSMLPRIVERSGNSDKGSITAFYTVLVEGDDMNEPIADATRGLLDGHIVLDRELAAANHFPAIDILRSVSRLERQIAEENTQELTSQARDLLSVYKKSEDLINVGAYKKGNSPKIDRAIGIYPRLVNFLKQRISEKFFRNQAIDELESILS